MKVVPHRIQLILPITFLRNKLSNTSICSLKLTLSCLQNLTLASLQRFLDNFNWFCLWLPLCTKVTQTLLNFLKRNYKPSLSQSLCRVTQDLNSVQVALKDAVRPTYAHITPYILFLHYTCGSTLSVPQGVLEWLYNPMCSSPKILN